MTKKIRHEVGSGNVFADIGLPSAEEHLIKAQLVYKIDVLMKAPVAFLVDIVGESCYSAAGLKAKIG